MTQTPYLIPTYNRLPVTFVRGRGAWLYDKNDKPYLDMLSGISVVSLGHAHPRLVNCLHKQSTELWHTSNLYQIEKQQLLAENLCRVSKMQQTFICNSGTEANEAAIKIARLYGNKQGIEKPGIIVFNKSFHGRTMGALSATGKGDIKKGFEPMLNGFYEAQFNALDSITTLLQKHPNIVAVLIEPVQGEGGINIAKKSFLKNLSALCENKKLLLMFDEIQSGMARSGHWFAHHGANISCDVMSVAKALGNGFPIGACLVNNKAMDIFSPGKHGTTFGGNPLACSVANEVIEIIQDEDILTQVAQLSMLFEKKLQNLIKKHSFLHRLKQCGLLIGIEFDENVLPANLIVPQALKEGLLINVTAGNIIRILPPFICDENEVEQACHLLDRALQKIMQSKRKS